MLVGNRCHEGACSQCKITPGRDWTYTVLQPFLGWRESTTAVAQANEVTVDPSGTGLPFDGNGGLSAGASSRLLFDYVEPARSEILDCACARIPCGHKDLQNADSQLSRLPLHITLPQICSSRASGHRCRSAKSRSAATPRAQTARNRATCTRAMT